MSVDVVCACGRVVFTPEELEKLADNEDAVIVTLSDGSEHGYTGCYSGDLLHVITLAERT